MKMLRFSSVFAVSVSVLCLVAGQGYPQALDWARRAGGAENVEGEGITAYQGGETAVVGAFGGTAIFGPGESGGTALTSAGGYDAFIARHHPDGRLRWARRAGGTQEVRYQSVANRLLDGSLVTGYFRGTASFGEVGDRTAGGTTFDSFVVGYSDTGASDRYWTIGGHSSNAFGRGICRQPQGYGFYVTGSFDGVARFYNAAGTAFTSLTSAGGEDAFFALFGDDSSGNVSWVTRAGGTDYHSGSGIAYSYPRLYATGVSKGHTAFHSTGVPGIAGNEDIFIVSWSYGGSLAWAKKAGGTGNCRGRAITTLDPVRVNDLDVGANVAVTGYIEGTATFGQGEPGQTVLTSAGGRDIFIARYNYDGTLAWAKRAGGTGYASGEGISHAGGGSTVVTGYFEGTVVFGPGEGNQTTLTSAGGDDIFIAQYNADGTLARAKRVGGTGWDTGNAVASIGGSSWVTGYFRNTAVFGQGEDNQTTLVSAGNRDAFVARYDTPMPLGRTWITDYNGDGTSDVAIFRRSSGLWAVRGVTRVYFGGGNDRPVPGDYNGDGTTEVAIFRPSSGLWAVRGVTRAYFGTSADIPVPGDYNGDGSWNQAIFRPTTGLWAVRGVTRAYFGYGTDRLVPGHYGGPGEKRIAIFRPSSGLWAVRGLTRIYFGGFADTTVPGDYNGDGRWSPAIFRPSSGLWAVRGVTRTYFGGSTDTTIPGGYRGDGTDYLGIFRGASGLWAIRGVTRVYFGSGQDVPVTR